MSDERKKVCGSGIGDEACKKMCGIGREAWTNPTNIAMNLTVLSDALNSASHQLNNVSFTYLAGLAPDRDAVRRALYAALSEIYMVISGVKELTYL